MTPTLTFVTPSLSAEARSGGELRTQRLLQALSRETVVELVVLGARSTAAELEAATGCQVVHTFPAEPSGVRKRLRALRRRWPLPTAGWFHHGADALVRRADKAGRTIVFDHIWVATTTVHRSRVVLATQNAEAELLRHRALPAGRLAGGEARWNRWTTRRLQQRALAAADLIVTVTPGDAEQMGVSSLVIPNGADVPPLPAQAPDGGDLLFVGSMEYPPNEEAVRWWAAAVWPLLRQVPPLTVVGRASERVLGDLVGHAGVKVVGEVPDLTPYLAAASLVVVPLLSGSGSRLKVLEALAWRRPVVSTSKGVEGLPVVHGGHALVGDGPEAFAAAVEQLYSDRLLAHRLADQGRSLAECARWEVVCGPFVRAVTADLGHR